MLEVKIGRRIHVYILIMMLIINLYSHASRKILKGVYVCVFAFVSIIQCTCVT